MAQKDSTKIGNRKPTEFYRERTLSYTSPNDIDCAGESVPNTEVTLSNIIRYNHFEVGNSGSSFSGTDSYGNDIKNATFAEREPLMVRYNYIQDVDDYTDDGDDAFLSSILSSQYYYEQDIEGRNKLKQQIPRWENQVRPFITYDEEYFQHVFNWPTSHTLKTRKVGGFLEETKVCACTGEGQQGGSSTTYTTTAVSVNFNGGFSLDKTRSELYWLSTDSNGNWTYNPLSLDAESGEISGSNSETLTDKIGQPIIYHGGTDDNCIFFNYLPENVTTNSTNKSSTIEHIFDDPANVTNSLTSSNSSVTISPISPADLGGGDDSNARKHYEVTISGAKIGAPEDILIQVTGDQSASGLRTSTFEVSRIQLLSEEKFKVWFKAGNGDNSYVRDWTVSFGQPSTYTSGSTTTLIPISDTVNGATITNIVNYVVDVALKRIASASSKKNEENANITESAFVSNIGTTAEFNRTKGWIHLNAVTDLTKGMVVRGEGLREGTRITGIDSSRRIIYIDKPLSGSVKSLRFTGTGVNRVNTHTLCYATISGGSNFTADTTYTTGSGIKIVVRAGKGIINRSAIVGVYKSKNRKQIKYSPIFYDADPFCKQETDEDNNGVFVLGSVRWDNNEKDSNLWLMTKPKTDIAYKIASIYMSFTLAPIDRDTFETFLNRYNKNKNIIALYGEISSYTQSTLGGKKAASVYDDLCRDELKLEYFKTYEPTLESDEYGKSVNEIGDGVNDSCLPNKINKIEENNIKKGKYNEISDVQKRFEDIVNNSISQSSFLSEEYYNKLVGDEDSLMNRIKTATENMIDATPTEKIDNFPPTIEGTDDSGVENFADSYRDLPPAMDRVKYFIEDLLIADDRYMNPTLDLDPATTINQPRLVIRSKPCWTWTDSATSYSYPVSSGSVTSTINITVNTDSDGYVTTITSAVGAVTAPASTFVAGTAATGTVGEPGYVAGTFGSGCSYSGAWRIGPKSAKDNLYMGERAESMGSGAYYEAINSSLDPKLRDLDYKDRDSDDDVSSPTAVVYPKVLWEPNVSYQMDFYKLFWFRLNELTELVGESLENFGNPYLDNPIRAKIREDITSSTTSIKVDSTIGFLSSGYLSIPKYTKKISTDETGNNKPYFSYSGEEIIYYGSKTATSFDNIVRGALSSSSEQLLSVNAREVQPYVRYKITSLGDTDWSKFGGPANANVGDVFVANGSGNGTGTVEIFASNDDKTPEPYRRFGSTITPKVAIISSYEQGFGISQFWVNRLRES